VVLGDEINRAPAKTQSALLEAMQERQVTIDGETHPLAEPFFVLATQNPIEQEGTYPLPEAQVDRFLMRVVVPYPSPRTRSASCAPTPRSRPSRAPCSLDEVLWLQQVADAVHVDDEVYAYAVALAQYTRTHPRIALGASPRASLGLVLAARAAALIDGPRASSLPDDVKRVAQPVIAHRIMPHRRGRVRGRSRAEALVDEALAARAVPPRRRARAARVARDRGRVRGRGGG
jgi:MoxR-like ATPase